MGKGQKYLSFFSKISGQKRGFFLASVLALLILGLANWATIFSSKIDFNSQVKPIFNKRCIHCHGGVKKNGGFSLMTRAQALSPTESGKPAIVPGNPNASELIHRILAVDPEVRMPSEAAPLPKEEINILRKWIKQGAEWGVHWAYQPVAAIDVPKTSSTVLGAVGGVKKVWERNDIDHFISLKLLEQGLSPAQEADKATLLRRLSLDLIGVPAPESLANAYLADPSAAAYEQLVDGLLASPQFGERWAAVWLDLARYADSKGYERDADRIIWPYRDWLIKAFNQDMPYDQFLTEQLAGDLLPNPSDAQYIATGFHRNTPTNDEGGTDNEEFRVAATLNRVNTTWEALMGTTFACTQCHGHPYDPFEHDEYYKFLAFFNNTRDEDTYDDYPWIKQFTKEDSLALMALKDWVSKVSSTERAQEMYTFLRTWQPAYNSLKTDLLVNAALYDTKFLGLRHHGSARLPQVDLTGRDHLIYRYSTHLDGGKGLVRLDSLNGPILGTLDIPKTKGKVITSVDLQKVEGVHDLYFTYEHPALEGSTRQGLNFDWFHFTQPFPGVGAEGYEAQKETFWRLVNTKAPYSLIMVENPSWMQRKTKVFDRGNWMVGMEEVEADVPNIFPALPKGAPRNRLGLAQWLTSKNHPLTARTMVNRMWEQLFGRGLVFTLEDLGTQGEAPSHPELLDWLAGEFMHTHQWRLKPLLKMFVSAATYRQAAHFTAEKQEKDPYNKWYSRGARVRLSAEQVRDQALAVSGLLSTKMYGPPVMPYQPEGIWSIPYNSDKWIISEGEDRYRRAIYTHWKRSALYPSMVTFDMAGRDLCSARRIRTNTPLQALVTLNDPAYVEAAQYFARNMQTKGGQQTAERIQWAYQKAINQAITPEKQAALQQLYEAAFASFTSKTNDPLAMIGDIKDATDLEDLAALVVVANAILNLDEFITKS